MDCIFRREYTPGEKCASSGVDDETPVDDYFATREGIIMSKNIIGRLTVSAGLAGLVLILLFLPSGGAKSSLSVIACAAAAAGYYITMKGMAEDAAALHKVRAAVLHGARRMVEKEGRLDDSRLAAILHLPEADVSRFVDFGMNRGWLPMNAEEGIPAPEMGCVIVDILKKPFTFQLFGKPVLMIDSNVCGRDHGSFLVTLTPGPHRISVKTTHRRKAPGGISRTVTKETGHSVLVREDCISGVQFNPILSFFSGGKFTDYSI